MGVFHDVALVGFSQSEYATFETFFRLVSSRRAKPFRASMQIANASLVMLNTSDTADIERTLAVVRPEQSVVSIGTRRVAGAWRHLERPINLNAVLMTVDAALSGAATPVATVAPSARPAAVSAANSPVRVAPLAESRPAAPAAAPVEPANVRPAAAPVAPRDAIPALPTNVTPFVRTTTTPPAPSVSSVASTPRDAVAPVESERVGATSSRAAQVRILVVDDSDVALKFIHARLSAFGFQVDKCTSGEEALTRVSDGAYAFVFLDVMMQGLDGYQTCKAIKGRRYPSGKAPVVAMLTSRGGTIDKVRGTFAGCDAYLTKPLDETKMLKILLKHDPNIGNSISTLLSPTTLAASSQPGRRADGGGDSLSAAYANLGERDR